MKERSVFTLFVSVEEGCVLFLAPPQNYFNICRDNEARAARHSYRTDVTLFGLGSSGMGSFRTNHKHIGISDDDDVASIAGDASLRGQTFRCDKASGASYLHFNSQEIVSARSRWQTTRPDKMELHQAMLLRVLLAAPEAQWGNLWLSGLYRSHSIICNEEFTEFSTY